MTCPDCEGSDLACFRCDGEGWLCDVCGEAPVACQCDEGPLDEED